MKLLYATNNRFKINILKGILEGTDIEVITPRELGISLDVLEDGKTAKENAIKKAKAYYEITHMPTIAADVSLYIENIPKEKQPGLFVRRVNGKVLTDEEMILYYKNIVEDLGGQVSAYFIEAFAIINEKGTYAIEIKDDNFILTSKPSLVIHPDYPLDSLFIDPVTNKYHSEMTKEEYKKLNKDFDKKCKEFVKNSLFNKGD